jgi:porin
MRRLTVRANIRGNLWRRRFAAIALATLGLGAAANAWAVDLDDDAATLADTHGPAPTVMESEGDCECQAGPAEAPPPQFGGCVWCRPKLTGDWNCHRVWAAEDGVTFDFDETLYYFGVTSGGLDRDWGLSGHGDYVINMDMNKLAGREGMFIKLRGEHRYGETIDGLTGALLPATVTPGLPVSDSEDFYLTNVLFTQALSENFAVFAGKIDTLDGDANAFAHGRGKTQFSNVGFVANPALLRTVPYSTLAAGFSILRELQPIFTFTAVNATDTTKTSGFDELFEEGVVLTAEARLPTQFLGKPGHQCLGGAWSSREFVTLGQDPRVILPNVPIATQNGSWALYWNFDQYLVTYADQPLAGWGVFGRASIADDHANPLPWFLSFGVGGNSPVRCRHQDTFGIGWYVAGSSDEIGPILTTALGPLGDGQAVELFYNYEVTSWCHVTADVQFLNPARENVDDATVAGLRMKVDF